MFAGCGGNEGPERYDLSGTVTYQGQPVPRGYIQFTPDSSLSNAGPAGYADIQDGKYDTSKNGKGTVGGPHTVTIEGYDGIAKPEAELPSGTPLFDEWNTIADLPKEPGAMDFKVEAAGAEGTPPGDTDQGP